MRTKTLAVAHEAEPGEGPEVQVEALRQRRADAADVLAETLLDLWLRRGPLAAAGRPPKDASPDEPDARGNQVKRDLADLSKR
jgi:hypothetical protein